MGKCGNGHTGGECAHRAWLEELVGWRPLDERLDLLIGFIMDGQAVIVPRPESRNVGSSRHGLDQGFGFPDLFAYLDSISRRLQ